jgi:tetratricopeptide (TPR) repeat protein
VIEVHYSIPLVSVSDDQKLDLAENLRSVGNDFYKQAKYSSALIGYKNGLFWACITENDLRLKPIAQMYGNMSAIHFQVKNYELAIKCASEALQIAEKVPEVVKNINALYIRRADAYAKLNTFPEAKKDLESIKNATEVEIKRISTITANIDLKTKEK